ncbi:RNA polymerase sigma factor CarQ [Planctomycetes bacterium Pan216]|uniref:RNA polymerase sigma factor CarQ n=2 Tax=Kolteria novifilia TaxID=2527975 RepID=A0A518B259_9BACT|nr:RNA polymerase sigma factor CarQ [Planctomycetes bacterium Pan216]
MLAHQFCELYNQHRQSLFAYLYSLVTDRVTAEDLLQETSLVMWREFDQFEPGTNFLAWARQVAFNRVRECRRRRQREGMVFSEEVVRQLADERAKMDRHLQDRWDQFQQCLTKLRDQDAELIDLYYANDATAEEVCQQTGRGIHAIRKAIKRIRRSLFECVGRNLPGRASS